jgi:hypothetical protein
MVKGLVEAVQSDADLLQVVLALASPGRFAGLLHGGKQQGNQHRNDGDHHQQLDQRETLPGVSGGNGPGSFHEEDLPRKTEQRNKRSIEKESTAIKRQVRVNPFAGEQEQPGNRIRVKGEMRECAHPGIKERSWNVHQGTLSQTINVTRSPLPRN